MTIEERIKQLEEIVKRHNKEILDLKLFIETKIENKIKSISKTEAIEVTREIFKHTD